MRIFKIFLTSLMIILLSNRGVSNNNCLEIDINDLGNSIVGEWEYTINGVGIDTESDIDSLDYDLTLVGTSGILYFFKNGTFTIEENTTSRSLNRISISGTYSLIQPQQIELLINNDSDKKTESLLEFGIFSEQNWISWNIRNSYPTDYYESRTLTIKRINC